MANKAKIGASIVLDGEKDFKDAVTGCNKKLRVLEARSIRIRFMRREERSRVRL